MASTSRAPARGRRCTLLVAAAGYGKTTALEPDPADERAVYLTAPEALERLGGPSPEILTSGQGRPVALVVVDDLDRLAASNRTALLRALGQVPVAVQLSLASRGPLANVARSLPGRTVLERSAADLALGPEDTARVLREEHGMTDAEQAYAAYQLTAGWPTLVHLAGDLVARHEPADLQAALSEPGAAAATWLQDQVLDPLPRDAADALAAAVELGPVSRQLFEDLAGPIGIASGERSRLAFGWLASTGLLVVRSRWGGGAAPEGYRPVPLLAAVVRAHRSPVAPATRQALWLAAAAW